MSPHACQRAVLHFYYTGKGGKNRRRGKKQAAEVKRELVYKKDMQGVIVCTVK